MSAAFMPPNEPHRMTLFGKVRRSFSSGNHSTKSPSNLSSPNRESHVTLISDDSGVKVKGRKSVWRKVSSNVKPTISDVPPALSLNFDKKEEPPAQMPTRPRKSLSRKLSSKPAATIPSPAAAVALAAASKRELATPEAQVTYHQNARLRVRQATELVQLCSQEIKMRGLSTLGIFRPFRAAESIQQQERLIELFLLYIDPKTYDGAFPVKETTYSTLLEDAMEPVDAESEFQKRLSSANIYDIVSLLKWGLRRLRLQPIDLNSFAQYSWYETFVKAEKDADYPIKAYSELFLPNLPTATQLLFDTVLDLMSAISAHHTANAMPASKICKLLGYWLVGKIGVDQSFHDLQGLVEAWETSARVMEHLLMAYIRNQSSTVHLMPSRLTEIVKDYPHLGSALRLSGMTEETPCLKARYSTMPTRSLLIEIQTENVIVSSKRPRGPRETLRAALKAQGANLDTSEELDDWSVLLGIACSSSSDDSEKEIILEEKGVIQKVSANAGVDLEDSDSRKETSLFSEEDARVMRIVSAECENRRIKSESKPQDTTTGASTQGSFLSDLGPIDLDGGEYRFSAQNLQALGWSTHASASTLVTADSKRASVKAKQSMSSGKRGTADWSAFTSDGFERDNKASGDTELDLKLNQAYKAKSELERAVDDDDGPKRRSSMRRQHSMGTIRRRRPYDSQFGSSEHDLSAYKNGAAASLQTSTHALQKVSLTSLDESFIHFWQDQLLDDCTAARLPYLIVANLNKSTASRLVGSGMGGNSTNWLVISESILGPRPPLPHSNSSRAGRALSILRRRNTSSATVDANVDSENRSNFAPSMRSNWTASFSRTKNGLKRAGSALNLRKSSIDRTQDQEKMDAALAEIQVAADESKRSRE